MASRPANPSTEAKAVQPQIAPAEPLAAFHFPSALSRAVERCWKKAAAPEDWHLSREQFVAALERSVAQRFRDVMPSERSVESYLESLHVSDLALASACSTGNPVAWDSFVAKFRPELYRAARAIAGEANSRDLADSLYADLYGLRESDGQRKSLFDYFHGRSKLSTWLRAVLAQRQVDEIRRTRKTEPLEDDAEAGRDGIASLAVIAPKFASTTLDTERNKHMAILQATLTTVLESLDARDRLRLAYYYTDDRTLAEIGGLLGEHEATVSRKLERTRRAVRTRVEAALRNEKKWTEAQVNLSLEYARGEWPFDLSEALRSQASLETVAEPGTASAPD